MSDKIKIAIADDHTLVRQSVAMALESEKSFSVVGQAENGQVLMNLLTKKEVDVIILDLEMPVMNGWEALIHIRKEYPHCKIIIVSMHFEGVFLKDLVSKGAHGFLPKNSDFETLINAVFEVRELGYFFSKKISRVIVKELLMSNSISPAFNNDSRLTGKEIQILLLICTDKSTKEIAFELKLTDRTIERYKSMIYVKTKAKTPAGLVLYALKHNIFSLVP